MKIILALEGKSKVHKIKVDDEDFKLLSRYKWIWRDGYACTLVMKRYYQMHRMIMGAQIGEDVIIDHEDGDHTNNQRYNLRRANRFQNQQNRKTNAGNTLPKGIRMLPNGKYNVRVQAYNKRVVFGAFDTLEEALEARNKKAEELHGEFARPAHMV